MNNFEIYEDIAKRTGGDIYIGVVGPVRTGKSTFISKFLYSSILDNISDSNDKKRTIDEMPQSGAGTTVMTMQPKFVPNEAVTVNFDKNISAKVRLIDCVGYCVDGANGFVDNNSPRMVKTPWSDAEMTFEEAAEIGTHKVISEHSTIAVLVTTDGSITEIPRENYVKAEERVVNELKQNGKPFVILLNSRNPENENSKDLASALQDKYKTPVLLMDISKIKSDDISNVIKSILMEFPITSLNFKIPKWTRALSYSDELINKLLLPIKQNAISVVKMSDYTKLLEIYNETEDVSSFELDSLDMSTGEVNFKVSLQENLFYKILSQESETEIDDDFCLMNFVKTLVQAKRQYDKIKQAMDSVKETGYGIVNPSTDDLILSDPEIVTKNGTSSLRLKATAPSLHIMRVDVSAELTPAMGNLEQGGSFVKFMFDEFENDKQEIWNKNIFGKPMNELMKDSIDSKLLGLPEDVQSKLRKTLTKIVNERKGGVICILL